MLVTLDVIRKGSSNDLCEIQIPEVTVSNYMDPRANEVPTRT